MEREKGKERVERGGRERGESSIQSAVLRSLVSWLATLILRSIEIGRDFGIGVERGEER